MNREEWRIYNRTKQKEYRTIQRGKPPRPYEKKVFEVKPHCPKCTMILESEYHQKHPCGMWDNWRKNTERSLEGL